MKNWRKSKEYRIWRIAVIRRDKRCVVCNSIKKRQAHHINSASYYPKQRYDIANGICLCKECHKQFHNNFKRSYRQKCTNYDFENFLSLVNYLKGIFRNGSKT